MPSDPTGAGICEAGFFDIYPEDDALEGGGQVAFLGTWSSYAYFKSGYIYINTIERGSFVVKMTGKNCPGRPRCEDNVVLLRILRGKGEKGREFCRRWSGRGEREGNEGEEELREYADAVGAPVRGLGSRVRRACACLLEG